jgi:hypothetical protein
MCPVEFEPASVQSQTHALDRAATGIGSFNLYDIYVVYI